MERRRRREQAPPAAGAALAARATSPVAAVLAAQQAHGNRAVSGVLAREPGREPPAKKPPIGGRQVDEILDASPYFKDLVAEKMKLGVRAEKQLRYDDEATFRAAWIRYAVGRDDPDTGRPHDEKSADLALRRGVRGFHDEERGEIHIRKERADEGTPLHEGLHLFTHDDFKAFAGRELNEGVTELFTRRLCKEVGAKRDEGAYLQEHHSVALMRRELMVDEDLLAGAYFKGDLDGLRRAMDGDKGMLERWTGFMNSRNFKAANELVRTPGAELEARERLRSTA